MSNMELTYRFSVKSWLQGYFYYGAGLDNLSNRQEVDIEAEPDNDAGKLASPAKKLHDKYY